MCDLDLLPPADKRKRLSEPVEYFPTNLSDWTKSELGIVGLCYEEEPVKDLEVLLNITVSYDSRIPPLSKKLQPIIKVLEYLLDFSVHEYQERVQKDIDKVTRFKEDVYNIRTSLTRGKETSFESVRHLFPEDLSGDETFLRR